MNLPQILGLIAGILISVGYIPYVYEVLIKKTVPSRASWIIWSISTIIIAVSVQLTGTTEAIWFPILDAAGCTLIFLLSIPYGSGGWNKADKISFAICAVSLVIWYFTGNALIALLMNLSVYVSGYIPTIGKVWRDPRHESRLAWSFFFIGTVTNLIAVIIGNDTGFAVWIYPVVLMVAVGSLYLLLFRNSKKVN
jgi:hypothetical protein